MGDLRSAGGAVEALLGEELATREEETSLPGNRRRKKQH